MFKGTGTALITPFDEDYNVDYDSLKKLVDFQISGGVDAIVLLGTTGETPVISLEERRKILDTGIQINSGRTKIIVGTGTNDTKKVVELNKIAEEYKPDALLIVNPYYNKGTQESLVEHYKYISERTTLPIILYNVPSRTGMNLLPETVIKIHEECKNVVAVKEASGNISQIAHLFSIKPASLNVLSGNDDQTLPIMALGGDGVVSVFSNPYPKQMKEMTTAILNNDYESAQRLNNKYLKMMNLLFIETSPSPVKFVMYEMGLCKNILRLPLIGINEKSKKLLIDEMKNF
ncbi:MAG TPA: 4-hydroxy-tetrahydrodipicolinate synthase [Ignavibacteriaceae bacterium]|nr:4-hydroxy-tetrahydrodipicolinate synthase [Ignavibacteriaceae bacterium]